MMATDVAKGLSAVHAVGIVHRDIKPENIFLARSPTGTTIPKLLDFGISKQHDEPLATQQGALTGTPAYMSPEQANGETNIDPRTDIWSLGVVLYEMLTGKHPFVAPNYQALMTAIAERSHAPLESTVPGAIRGVVDRCLAKRPDDRYATSDALVDALASVERGGASMALHDDGFVQRKGRWLILGAAFISLVVAGVATWIGMASDVPSATHSPSAATVAVDVDAHASSAPSTRPVVNVAPTSSVTRVAPSSMTSSAATTRKAPRAPGKQPSTSVTTPGF